MRKLGKRLFYFLFFFVAPPKYKMLSTKTMMRYRFLVENKWYVTVAYIMIGVGLPWLYSESSWSFRTFVLFYSCLCFLYSKSTLLDKEKSSLATTVLAGIIQLSMYTFYRIHIYWNILNSKSTKYSTGSWQQTSALVQTSQNRSDLVPTSSDLLFYQLELV